MDRNIYNLMKRLEKNGVAIVNDGQLVRNFSATTKIRKLRDVGDIYIAKDRRKKITIVLNKNYFDKL